MASNYTTNYELPLWEPQDSFLRTEFNEAHQKVDDALGTMADKKALDTLQAQMALKSGIAAGTYTGDNQPQRTISLGFTPKAVLICTSAGRQEYGSAIYGGLALTDHPCSGAFAIVEGGFRLYESGSMHCNATPYTYYYLAIG